MNFLVVILFLFSGVLFAQESSRSVCTSRPTDSGNEDQIGLRDNDIANRGVKTRLDFEQNPESLTRFENNAVSGSDALAGLITSPRRPVLQRGSAEIPYPSGGPDAARADEEGTGYVRLLVEGPGASAKLHVNFSRGSPRPTRMNFRIRAAQIYLDTHPEILGNARAELLVNGASQGSLYPVSCADTYAYDRTHFYEDNASGRRGYIVVGVCEYETRNVDIPYSSRPLSLTWQLISQPGFVIDNVRPCRDGNCSRFNPMYFLSIDNISFEWPAPPALACDSYESSSGRPAVCRLTEGGRAVRNITPYRFEVRRFGETSVLQEIAPISGQMILRQTTPGLYQIEGSCYVKEGRTNKLDCGHTTQMANVLVKDPNIVPPVAARIMADKAVVFPPQTLSNNCYTQGAVRYKVYRKDNSEAESLEITPAGGVDAGTMNTSGFIDETLDSSTNPLYAVRPIYVAVRAAYTGEQEGALSRWAQTSYFAGRPTIRIDHFPLPGFPTRIVVNWEIPPSAMQPATPIYTRLVPAEPNSALGFRREDPPKWTSLGRMVGELSSRYQNTGQGTGPSPRFLMTLAEAGLERIDYTGLPPTHSFWVLGGDLARVSLSLPQLLALVPHLDVAPTDLSECHFQGNQFLCPGGYLFTLPTLQIPLDRALIDMYYKPDPDPTIQGGLFFSSAWRHWFDANKGDLTGSKESMTSLSALNLANHTETMPYALNLATLDAQMIVKWDGEAPHNLFRTGSSLLTDWLPVFDHLFYQRYIQPVSFAEPAVSLEELRSLTTSTLRFLSRFEESYRSYHPSYAPGERTDYMQYALSLARHPSLESQVSLSCPYYFQSDVFPILETSVVWPSESCGTGLIVMPKRNITSAYLEDLRTRLGLINDPSLYNVFERLTIHLEELHTLDRIRYHGRTTWEERTNSPWTIHGSYCTANTDFPLYCDGGDMIVLGTGNCRGYSLESVKTMVHEARHRADFQDFWSTRFEDERDPEWQVRQRGQMQVWSEMKAFMVGYQFYEAVLESLRHPGLSLVPRPSELEILEKCVLANDWYSIPLSETFKICDSPCRRASDLRDTNGRPWSPIGKSSPWED